MPKRELIDTPPAAAYLGVSPHTMENWRYLGQGPRYFRIGSLIKYDVADLDAWLDEQARQPAA